MPTDHVRYYFIQIVIEIVQFASDSKKRISLTIFFSGRGIEEIKEGGGGVDRQTDR